MSGAAASNSPAGFAASFWNHAGSWWSARRRRARRLVEAARQPPDLSAITPDELRRRGLSLKHRMRSGLPWRQAVPEAFVLLAEAARRVDGQPLDAAELEAAALLAEGGIVEWGRAASHARAALAAACLHGMRGTGAHLLTADQALGARLADYGGRCGSLLGLSIVLLRSDDATALLSDVTCGTVTEFGFAFLRVVVRQYSAGVLPQAQTAPEADPAAARCRQPSFGVVLDADWPMLDECQTPFIISAPPGPPARLSALLCRWGAVGAGRLQPDRDFTVDLRTRQVLLTNNGCERLRQLPQPEGLGRIALWDRYEAMERALAAAHTLRRGRDYLVRDGRLVLIDAATGEPLPNRRFQRGLHQALEAKEGLEITAPDAPAAQVVLPRYLRRYGRLAGITTTATEAHGEFRRMYGLPVFRLGAAVWPAVRRRPWRVFLNRRAKWEALVQDVVESATAGRAVLLAAEMRSELHELTQMLAAAGARPFPLSEGAAREPLLAQAGTAGRVTVGTSLDWRGVTDLATVAPGNASEWHVVAASLPASVRHERRLRQLAGAGTYQQFLSLDETWVHRQPRAERLWEFCARIDDGTEAGQRTLRAVALRCRRRWERRQSYEKRRLVEQFIEYGEQLDELGPDQSLLLPY